MCDIISKNMPSKITSKNKDFFKEMEKQITPIFVMNNQSLKPYIELFEYHPDNLYQQPLGSLVGFFEIKDYTEDSAYIVNFLTSVLKKEYYMNPRRPVTDSFDNALHKVNIALSEIVKHGNVNWLGKLDAVVCVLEKNSIHFSVTGNGHLFINRKEQLTDISEGLAPEASDEPHPLKTFIDVSSGRIEEKDKILIFSDDMFHVLSPVELKKNIKRFEKENFVQFLKTALGNELEMTAAIVINVEAPEKKSHKNVFTENLSQDNEQLSEEFNAFSEKTYKKSDFKIAKEVSLKTAPVIEEKKEYTDKKTGHIYIQGEENVQKESTQFKLFMTMAKENIADFLFQTKTGIKRKFSLTMKNLSKSKKSEIQKEAVKVAEKQKNIETSIEETQKKQESKISFKFPPEKSHAKNVDIEKFIESKPETQALTQEKIKEVPEVKEKISENTESLKNIPLEIKAAPILDSKKSQAQNLQKPLSLQEKIEKARLEMDQKFDKAMDTRSIKENSYQKEEVRGIDNDNQNINQEQFNLKNAFQKSLLLGKSILQKTTRGIKNKDNEKEISESENYKIQKNISHKENAFTKIKPNFSKIKILFSQLSLKQKTGATFTILFIIFAPLIIIKITTPKPQPIVQPTVPEKTMAQKLSNEKNILVTTQTQIILKEKYLSGGVISYNNIPYAISGQKIFTLENNQPKEFVIPTGSGSPIYCSFMKDLNLIFILTEQGKIISFSPISKQFKNETIEFTQNFVPKFIATYLTYLYTPDLITNQIYRYPRAAGGFGSKINWLKENISLSAITGMAIDESVYLINNNKIIKLFKGTLTDIKFEDSQTPINFTYIYTTMDNSFVYALDGKNSRLIQYEKNGKIIKQYYNELFENSTSFAVDSQDQTAFIATPQGLASLSL